MSRTIRIDEEVYAALKANAEPFEDSPNDVLRRLLLLDTSSRQFLATYGDVSNVSRPRLKPAESESMGSERSHPVIVADDPMILMRITKNYKQGMSDEKIYEATRYAWNVGDRRENARLACAVYDGTVVGVYEIHRWRKSTPPPGQTWKTERWEFDGERADDDTRAKYLGKRVAHWFARGSQNPITYVNC
jgi:hypothetical protein